MSKPVKEMIMGDYAGRFGELDGALVVSIRGLNANGNNALRAGLREKNIRVTIVKNTLARKEFQGTALESLAPALEGPSAIAYGESSVVDIARVLVEWAKKVAMLELKGAVLDGVYFDGEAGVKRLSEFPTKEEARAKVLTIALSPGRNVVGCAVSPGGKLLGIIKEIQERLEKGEEIRMAG